MNERIKELEAQCWESRSHPNAQAAMGDRFNTEKFAELIVRECCGAADDWYQRHELVHCDPAQHIRNHFGV